MKDTKPVQLAFKGGKWRKLLSPGEKETTALKANGWELFGFDKESDIPVCPVLDKGAVRAMTPAEIKAAKQAKKPAETVSVKKEG